MQSRFGARCVTCLSATLLALILGCGSPVGTTGGGSPEETMETDAMPTTETLPPIDLAAPAVTRTATFALG